MKKEKKKKNGYFKEVGKELSKVKWPEKKDIVKYTVSTVVFILVVVGFFMLLTMGMSWIVERF
ncbi:MAG: preprotein translocase subunit SecE [Bacilli bacterium]|nr:preprotein translocase subunit SecE [Bacilli bacterium]